MSKRFRFKISKVLSFKSCRSKDPSALPSNPVPSFLRPSPVNPSVPTVDFPPTATSSKSSKHHRSSSFKRHVSSAFGCGLVSGRVTRYLSDVDRAESSPPPTPSFLWGSEAKWHVMAKASDDVIETPRRKVYNGTLDGDALPTRRQMKKRKPNKKKRARRTRISTSSADHSGIIFTSESFEDDEVEETGSLMLASSRSLSTEKNSFSDPNPNLRTIHEVPRVTQYKTKRNSREKPPRRRVSRETARISTSYSPSLSPAESDQSPVRLSSFVRRFVPCTAAAVEGVAVVKRSKDPYDDFKGSMMEMIVENQMFHERDLEELLCCFLSLNSKQHHGVIVRAFTEIWDVLFSSARSGRSSSVHRSSFKCFSYSDYE